MKKKQIKNFSLKFELAAINCFTANTIINFVFNQYAKINFIKIFFAPFFTLFYKLFIFFNQLNQLIGFVKIEKREKENITIEHIPKLSRFKFANFLQDLLFSGLFSTDLLVNLFFEIEFFFEKKCQFLFDQFLNLFFWILFVNISLFLDQSIIEHSMSLIKSFNDFRIDLFGINKIQLLYENSDQLFTDTISNLYEISILQINQKNINFLFNKKTKVLNFRKNYKFRYIFSALRVKFKIKKNKFQELTIDTLLNKAKYKKLKHERRFYWFKINTFFFLNMINTLVDNFKIDTEYIFYKIIELYWFQFSLGKTHFINHITNDFFFHSSLYIISQKNKRLLLPNTFWWSNICNLLFCYKEWTGNIIKNTTYLDIKTRNHISNLFFLTLNNLNLKIILKKLILSGNFYKDSYFFLEILKKSIDLNTLKFFFKISNLRSFVTPKQDIIRFRKKVYFLEQLFIIITTKKKNTFTCLKLYFKNITFRVPADSYLMFIILSIIFSNRSIYTQLIIIQYYKQIPQELFISKVMRFICTKTFILSKSCKSRKDSTILLEKLDFQYIIDAISIGRIINMKQEFSILNILNFLENVKLFFHHYSGKKKSIKKDKKKISNIIKKYVIKKKIFAKSFMTLKQIESIFRSKNCDAENSILEFFDIYLNIFFKNSKDFYILPNKNKQNYIKWYLFFNLSFLFKKKANKYKIKCHQKLTTKKTIFIFK
nr:hypothetical protein Cry52Nrm3_p102 [Cryptomonas curvata]